MIEPHGGELIDRTVNEKYSEQLRSEADSNESIKLTSKQYQDAINIGTGRFSPIKGFLTRNDFLKVVHDMTLEDGTVWTLPITLDINIDLAEKLSLGEKVSLISPSNQMIGVIKIEEIYKHNPSENIKNLFGTEDKEHPGVTAYHNQGSFFVGGPIYLFDEIRYNSHDLLPVESRVLFQHRGWETIVGFQTRNAPHRAHEYLQKTALEQTDGLLIQPKLGAKKVGDYTDQTILEAYEVLIKNYYQQKQVALSVFPSQMRYAGPREAVFDAIIRKNQGCSHFIIGRDHAGVGDYYDDFGSQSIFNQIGDIGVQPMFFDYAFYCQKCDGMASENICPHEDSNQVHPSGTSIRSSIKNNKLPSDKMMRPEVASHLLNVDKPFIPDQTKE